MSGLASDAEIARLCNGIYDYPGYAPIAWDHLEAPERDDGVCWGLKRLGDFDVIVLRGSTSAQDWLRDFDCFADPAAADLAAFVHHLGFTLSAAEVAHDFLGPVHPGFLAGMEAAWAALRPLLGEFVMVSGHSLGAGRAAILTGLMVQAGRPPLRRICFGEPRPGFAKLARLIEGVPATSYQNGSEDRIMIDMITEVPVAIGVIGEDYVHCCPLSPVTQQPNGTMFERWGPFGWHGMPLYLRALERCEGLPLSGPVDLAPAVGVGQPHLSIH